MDGATLWAVGAAFVVVTVPPGPANLAAATVAMAQGRRRGMTLAPGLSAEMFAAAGFGPIRSALVR